MHYLKVRKTLVAIEKLLDFDSAVVSSIPLKAGADPGFREGGGLD